MVKSVKRAERILGKRMTTNGPLYLVKWKDSAEDNTWLPPRALRNCQPLLQQFGCSSKTKSTAKKTITVGREPITLHVEPWYEVKNTQDRWEILARTGNMLRVRLNAGKTQWLPVKEAAAMQPLTVVAFLVTQLRTQELGEL